MNGFVADALMKIKHSTMLLAAVGLLFGTTDINGQSNEAPSKEVVSSQDAKAVTIQAPPSQVPAAEILSDTQGVDFGPYIKNAMGMIKRNWIPLIPEEARPPLSMQCETLIRFSINPDGTIRAMHLDRSSQNIKIDRAAWGGVSGVGRFAPLPPEFKGSYLDLRIDFFTNRPVPAHPPATP